MRSIIDSPKLPTTTRFCLRTLALLGLALAMSACSLFHHKRDNIDTMPVDVLYKKAHVSLENADYSAAIKDYQRLIARFPAGDYNEQAQLELTYAQYKDAQWEDAYSTINRFIKADSSNKHIDYAYYLRGLINFDRTTGFMDKVSRDKQAQSRRDQGYNLQSFDDFAELSRRFPNSAYAADARQRMIYLRNVLAQYEVNVAEFYLFNRVYVGAADRAQYVIEHYQQAPQTGDALAILTRSYLALKEDKLADQTRQVLALNYPDHPYLKDPTWPHEVAKWRKMVPFMRHH
ncbi:outer membrane protein assembly factor BamD [Rhodanobacter sp. 7MK24]|uniref:outer membrane protein assembly factor BamD n=1 Tax=Rhodanobacter sp. 7MK24 TaxID=2775922 RepID=UPI00178050B5|nr:outer membrane protein assembly factor BamD [Rhodanobacter sp. 7MK24]MBD8878876.1 outer membrane protein assembly factor BamD [Rhodanobacter sp. 7MK24]